MRPERIMTRTAAILLTLLTVAQAVDAKQRPRARELGVAPGVFQPGPLNAITDVSGVLVGRVTVIERVREILTRYGIRK